MNIIPGVCISYPNAQVGYQYECDTFNGTLRMTTYQTSDCSAAGESVVYQLGFCLSNPEENRYFSFECNSKSLSDLYGQESAAPLTPVVPVVSTPELDSPTSLSVAYYSNPECAGEPYLVQNETLSVCDGNSQSWYVSPDGQSVYVFQAAFGCFSTYSSITRFDTMKRVTSDSTCSQFMVTNPSSAPPLPLAFPPQGWLQTITYLNVTTGEPNTNCNSTRTIMEVDHSLCVLGQQSFCDGAAQVAATFTHQANDTYCQRTPISVQLSALVTGQSSHVSERPSGERTGMSSHHVMLMYSCSSLSPTLPFRL